MGHPIEMRDIRVHVLQFDFEVAGPGVFLGMLDLAVLSAPGVAHHLYFLRLNVCFYIFSPSSRQSGISATEESSSLHDVCDTELHLA